MKGSCRSSASTALHAGRLSVLSRRGVTISGNNSATVGKPARRFAIAVILRLPEHKLPAIRGIAEVQPIDALFEERRLRNVEPRGTRVHARNNDARFTLSFRGHILCRGVPVEFPKQVSDSLATHPPGRN